MIHPRTTLGLLLSFCCLGPASAQNLLSLPDYLSQVQAAGPAYLGSLARLKDVQLSRTLLAKHWNASLAQNDDYSGNYDYTWSFNSLTRTYNYFEPYRYGSFTSGTSLDLSNDWDFGLSTSATESFYSFSDWNDGPASDFYPGRNNYDVFSLNAGLPLWRNFLGRRIHAQDQRDYLANDAAADSARFQVPAALYAAKLAYFTLAQVRAELEACQKTLAWEQGLADWAKAHGSRLDRLRADSALEREELAVDGLEDTERLDRDAFNQLRGEPGSEVPDLETLEGLDGAARGQWDPADPDRLDLQSLEEGLASARQNLVVDEEDTKVDIELKGSLGGSLFSADSFFPAPPPAGEFNYPELTSYAVGFSASIPLDVFTSRWDAQLRGDRIDLAQGEVDLRTARQNADRQWEDMTQRFGRSADRIAAAGRWVDDSREKGDQALSLVRKGGISFFEALSDVGSYDEAVASRAGLIGERLSLLAQAEWYRTGPPTPP